MNVGFEIQPNGYFYALPTAIGINPIDLILTPEPVFIKDFPINVEPPLWLGIALDAARKLNRMTPLGRA